MRLLLLEFYSGNPVRHGCLYFGLPATSTKDEILRHALTLDVRGVYKTLIYRLTFLSTSSSQFTMDTLSKVREYAARYFTNDEYESCLVLSCCDSVRS